MAHRHKLGLTPALSPSLILGCPMPDSTLVKSLSVQAMSLVVLMQAADPLMSMLTVCNYCDLIHTAYIMYTYNIGYC